MKKAFKVFGVFLLAVIVLVFSGILYVKFALPNVGAAPAFSLDRSVARVERGKYLANHVAVCMDCHSTRDWTTFAAPLSGNFGGGGEKFGAEMGFPGNFYSKNITPHALGNWTDGEIFRAITTGVSKDGHALFPIMPYAGFGQLDEEDIYSIIAYLRTIEPSTNEVPESKADFPVNVLLNTMPAKASFSKRPAESDTLAYGKYLATAANCVECHSKMDKGAKVPGTEYGGGMEFKLPSGTVVSANISPNQKTGIGLWTAEAFVKRFKTYADSTYKPHKIGKGDFNTPMPWAMYAGMKESDLRAIYAYLQTVKPQENAVTKFTPAL